MPIKFKLSHIKVVFIFLSKGLEELKLGDILISSKWGFKFESSRISNPNISKHIFLFLLHL
jgi:hypothetical protein